MAKTPSPATSTSELPSIGDLFRQSWDRLKLVWGKLLGIYLLMMVIIILGGGAFLAVTASMLIGSTDLLQNLGSPDGFATALAQVPAGAWGTVGFLALIGFLVLGFVSTAFQAALVLAVAEAENKPKVGELLSRGFGVVIPLFLTGLLATFFVFGGLFLLIIPGIVIAVLLAFAQYEVILGRAKFLTALRNSAQIVSQNFGGILVRWLVLFVVNILISYVLGTISENSGALSGLFGLLSLVVNVVITGFSLVYAYLMYQHARTATTFKEGNLLWMWIVALLGWVVGVFILVNASRSFGSVLEQMTSASQQQQMLQESDSLEDYQFVLPEGTEGSEEIDVEQLNQDMQELEQYLRENGIETQ